MSKVLYLAVIAGRHCCVGRNPVGQMTGVYGHACASSQDAIRT